LSKFSNKVFVVPDGTICVNNNKEKLNKSIVTTSNLNYILLYVNFEVIHLIFFMHILVGIYNVAINDDDHNNSLIPCSFNLLQEQCGAT